MTPHQVIRLHAVTSSSTSSSTISLPSVFHAVLQLNAVFNYLLKYAFIDEIFEQMLVAKLNADLMY